MRVSEIFLDEAMATSNIKVTKMAKLKQQGGSQAFRLAKAAGDPMYKKYTRWRTLALEMKAKIVRKYGARGLRKARSVSRGGFVKPTQRF